MSLRRALARSQLLRVARACQLTLSHQFGLNLRWVGGLIALARFAAEYRRFRGMNEGSPFVARPGDILPCLTDRTETTPIEPIYFLQDNWCAAKIAQRRPAAHVDIGSSARSMALIAQFVPLTFVDIRPIDLEVRNLSFKRGSVLDLPFAASSIDSLSSLCVIEHIGLGRYGDPLDRDGSEKAAAELTRVLAPGGDLYFSVPVDDACRIYFNAHRAFTRAYVLALFPDLRLLEERYIYGRELVNQYEPQRGFGTGLFHFQKT